MIRLRRALMFVLLIALVLPAWTAGAAQPLTTAQKFEVLVQKGIFTGFEDGSARLGDPMTREQFAAVIFRLWGLKELLPNKATYVDVLRTRWSFGEVEAVTEAGLMAGMGNGKFSPASNVTIEQLATVLVRAYGYSGAGKTAVAGKVSEWARGTVGIALDRGYIPPQSNYTIAATRALLVEAAYAAYEQMNASRLAVASVQPLSNNTIQVALREAVTSVDLSHFSLADEQGHAVPILGVSLSTDGKTATLVTGAQVAYLIHTLKIDGDGWRYTSLPAAPAGDTVRPYVVSVTGGEGRIAVTFQEPVDAASATNRNNYGIVSGSLDLLSFQLSGDGRTVTIGTSAQRQGATYRLSVQGVADLSGNVMSPRTDLYFTGVADTTKPTVESVKSGNDGTIRVVFSEKVDAGDAKRTGNYRADGDLRVTRAALAGDGRTVTLSTSAQTNGREYKLTIRDIADLSGNVMDAKTVSFIGLNDRDKPYVTSVTVLENAVVRVQFNEKVDAALAANRGNYSVDNGLAIYGAYLDDGGDAVLLSTSQQKDGTLYHLTVRNVADLAGNVMETQSGLLFGGLVDNQPPTVTGIVAGAGKVVLTFSERLDASSASRTGNYRLSGNLGYPSSAQYDDAKRTVTLTTAAQTPGAVYTLTIGDVRDLNGLPIAANTQLQFVGVASEPGAAIELQTIAIVNQNTVQATFSRSLYDADVSGLKLAVIKDGGAAMSNGGWESFVMRKPGDDRTVLVQFRTDDGNNPKLFVAGHYYTGRVTGIEGLKTASGANEKPFAGTQTENAAPSVSGVKALDNRTVEVTFSEPVVHVGPEGFRLLRADDSEIPVVADNLDDRGRIVGQVLLYLGEDLQSGQTYRLRPQASIVDAAGWNAIRTTAGDSKPAETAFAGTSAAHQPPRIDRVVSNDRYTFEIKFASPVRNADGRGFTLQNASDGTDVNVDRGGYASYVLSGDRRTLTVYLDATKGQALQAGKRYMLAYDAGEGRIADDLGVPLAGSSGGAIETSFASTGADKSGPAIAQVEARGSLLLVTFSEDITGYTDQTDFFDIRVGGADVHPTAGSLQGRTVTLKVPAQTSGRIGTIRVSSAGAGAIRDYNRLAPSTDEVAFGVQ